MATQLDVQVDELRQRYNLDTKGINSILDPLLEQYRNSFTIDLLEKQLRFMESTGQLVTKTTVEAEATKEIDKNYIEYPLPAHNKVLRNGKFKINTFTSMMTDSNKNIEGVDNMGFSNYLYENKLDEVIAHINELEVEAGKRPTSKRTINNHIKSIIGTGYGLIELQNTPNGLVYKLKAEVDGGYYVKIPYCQIRDLLVCANKNMLRLYIFLKDYLKNAKQGEFTTIDRSFIARSIGLSGNAGRLAVISTMVNGLARLGYIEIKKVNESYVDKDGNKAYRTINSYRIRTLEEWEAIKKQAGGGKSQ